MKAIMKKNISYDRKIADTLENIQKPKAYEDIDAYLLFEGKEELYAIGSKEQDRYIVVKKDKYKYFLSILKDLDGEKDIKTLSILWNMPLDGAKELIHVFGKKNLLSNVAEEEQHSEVKRLSLPITSFSLEKMWSVPNKMIKVFIISVILLSIIIFLINCFNIIFREGINFSFRYEGSYVVSVLLSTILMIPSFIFHEMGHALAAMNYGSKPSRMYIVLYLYLFPMFYIKINGIYAVSRKKRIKILMAGIITNLIIANIAVLLNYVTRNEVFILICIAQMNLIIVNLNPFILSDGYFTLMQILKRVNIRSHFFYCIANDLKGIRKKGKEFYLYASSYIIIILYMIFYFVNYYFNAGSELLGLGELSIATTSFIVLGIFVLYIFIIRIRFKIK